MSDGFCFRKEFAAVLVVFFSLAMVSSIAGGAYVPYIKFDAPVKSGNNLGIFVRSQPLDVDFNLSFDYPLPTAKGESLVTATISSGDSVIASKTVQLRPYLDKYKITTNGIYVYKPIYFNFSVDLRGRNVSYEPIMFDYNVTQVLREPKTGEDDQRWKVWGRSVQDLVGGKDINDSYCSGPWDFEGNGRAQETSA